MPWAIIPALVLVTLSIGVRPGYLIWDFESAFILISAWVGYCYGKQGAQAVLIAAIIALLTFYRGDVGVFRFTFGLSGGYAFAGYLAAWFLSDPEHSRLIREKLAESPKLIFLIFFLPIGYISPHTAGFSIFTGGQSVTFVALFLISYSVSNALFKKLAFIMFIALLLGSLIYLFYLSSSNYRDLRNESGILYYYFNSFRDYFTALTYVIAGGWLRRCVEDGERPFNQSRTPFFVILLGMLFYSLLRVQLIVDPPIPGIESIRAGILISGHIYTAAFCFFLAGVFYGMRGYVMLLPLALIVLVGLQNEFIGRIQFGGTVGVQEFGLRIIPARPENLSWIYQFFIWTFAGDQFRRICAGEFGDLSWKAQQEKARKAAEVGTAKAETEAASLSSDAMNSPSGKS